MAGTTDRLRLSIEPGGALHGATGVAGDKSISHRALIFGAIANGVTRVEGFLDAEDTLATLEAMRALGVRVQRSGTSLRIHGVGRGGLRRPDSPLGFGNSGTGMRLAAGLLVGQDFSCRLVGDASLSRRPMGRIRDPLLQMGARIRTGEGGTPPLEVGGGGTALRGIDYDMPVASAQVKSCLLIAGLYARGTTRVRESAPSRDPHRAHARLLRLPGGAHGAERDAGGGRRPSGTSNPGPRGPLVRRFPHGGGADRARFRTPPGRRGDESDPNGGHRHPCGPWEGTSKYVRRREDPPPPRSR